MDHVEELTMESMAFAGSIVDKGNEILTAYPDLPEEVKCFVTLMVQILEYAEAEIFTSPTTETFISNLIEEKL